MKQVLEINLAMDILTKYLFLTTMKKEKCMSIQLSSVLPIINKLSTSIYDLVLIYVCHFHLVLLLLLLQSLFKFVHYRDTRAAILDPCIQGIFKRS